MKCAKKKKKNLPSKTVLVEHISEKESKTTLVQITTSLQYPGLRQSNPLPVITLCLKLHNTLF